MGVNITRYVSAMKDKVCTVYICIVYSMGGRSTGANIYGWRCELYGAYLLYERTRIMCARNVQYMVQAIIIVRNSTDGVYSLQ